MEEKRANDEFYDFTVVEDVETGILEILEQRLPKRGPKRRSAVTGLRRSEYFKDLPPPKIPPKPVTAYYRLHDDPYPGISNPLLRDTSWLNKLSKRQINFLSDYTQSGEAIKDPILNKTAGSEYARAMIAAIDDALEVVPALQEPLTLYRGVGPRYKDMEYLQRLTLSASTHESVAWGFTKPGGVVQEFRVHPGVKLLPIGQISRHGEKELIIDNASYFEYVGSEVLNGLPKDVYNVYPLEYIEHSPQGDKQLKDTVETFTRFKAFEDDELVLLSDVELSLLSEDSDSNDDFLELLRYHGWI